MQKNCMINPFETLNHSTNQMKVRIWYQAGDCIGLGLFNGNDILKGVLLTTIIEQIREDNDLD